MSKIKRLKIQQSDGSFIEQNLGANASNVDYGTVNVEQALDNIELVRDETLNKLVLTKPDGTKSEIELPEGSKIIISSTEPIEDYDIWIDESNSETEEEEQAIAADILDYYRKSEIDEKFQNILGNIETLLAEV